MLSQWQSPPHPARRRRDEKPATSAQSQSASDENAAKACKAERKSLGVEAFNKKYGTNHNLKNAFGKCVSGKSKGEKDDEDEKDEDEKDEDEKDEDSGRRREGMQGGEGVHRCRCLRQEVRDEPQPEERLREVRIGQVEGLGTSTRHSKYVGIAVPERLDALHPRQLSRPPVDLVPQVLAEALAVLVERSRIDVVAGVEHEPLQPRERRRRRGRMHTDDPTTSLANRLACYTRCKAIRSLRMTQLAPDAPATVFVGAHVDDGTRDQLRALAREEERSISAILRRALRHELERVHDAEGAGHE